MLSQVDNHCGATFWIYSLVLYILCFLNFSIFWLFGVVSDDPPRDLMLDDLS